MGRNNKTFTDHELSEIKGMAAMGLTQRQIADIKSISVDTLRKHAYNEWRQGKSMGIGKVIETGYKMATSGLCPQMTRFFIDRQGGPSWQKKPNIPKQLLEALGLDPLLFTGRHGDD
jgi:hypothetical protein